MGKKNNLTHDEKRILLQSFALRCAGLFEKLQDETMDLNVMEFFDKYYRPLYKLINFMEMDYPKIDMSTRDIDLLYKRIHMMD